MRTASPGEGNGVLVRILITGVRGKTGVPLAGLLTARPGVEVRGGSSDPSTVAQAGVVPTAFDWDDRSSWAPALDGVDAVYVVRPDRPEAPEQVAALAAATAPDTRLVLLSEREADYPALDRWSLRCERAVRDSGRPWTALRPGWFMQVLDDERFYRGDIERGVLPFPSAGASVAWIDARDIAAVAEQALLGGHEGEALELTGPEALTLPRTAELLTHHLGHRVVHEDVSMEEALAGTEGFERALTEATFERVRAGTFAVVTDTVERITGRPARPLADVLAER